MLALEENVLLKLSVFDLVVLNQNILPDCLDSILLARLRQLSKENLTKSTPSQQANQLEILVLNSS